MRKILAVVVFFSFLIVSLSYPSISTAAEPINLTTTPIFFDLTANPGDIIQNKIHLRNNALSPVDLKLEVKKIVPLDSGSGFRFEEPTFKDDFIKWFHLSKSFTTIGSKEWMDIPFTISIPKVSGLDYNYVIFVSQKNTTTTVSGAVSQNGILAIPVIVGVRSANASPSLQLLSFSTPHMINEYLPIDFNVKIKNIGNIHVRTRGNIFITGSDSKDLAILEVNQTESSILPAGVRTFVSSWDDGFLLNNPVIEDGRPKIDKNGNVIRQLEINWNKLTSFRFGKYNADLVMVYDNGTRDATLEASTSFWVIPYTLIAIIFGLIIAIIVLIRMLLKLYVKQALKKYHS